LGRKIVRRRGAKKANVAIVRVRFIVASIAHG